MSFNDSFGAEKQPELVKDCHDTLSFISDGETIRLMICAGVSRISDTDSRLSINIGAVIP